MRICFCGCADGHNKRGETSALNWMEVLIEEEKNFGMGVST